VRLASVCYSARLVSAPFGIDAIDPPVAKNQPQQVSSTEQGPEPVGGLLSGLATTATALLVVGFDFLDLMEVGRRQGVAGAQSSLRTVGSHPSVSILQLAVQAGSATLRME
jgi:hypothetical protein